MGLNLKKLRAGLGKALVNRYADQVEAEADKVIDKGAEQAHKAVGKAIKKAKGVQ